MRAVALCLTVAGACVIQRETTIHEPDNRGFENHEVTVIGLDPAHGAGSAVWFDGHCVWLEDGECLLVDPRGTWCELETVPMDVVLAFNAVSNLICYREREPVFYIGPGLGDLLIPHTGVGGTVYFLDSSDGVPLEGDLYVRGDEIMVWGRSQELTVIDGDVSVSGDGVQLRNLTITGDLVLNSSAVSMAYVAVRGSLYVYGQRSVIAKNLVFGSLEVHEEDNVFVDNGVQAGLVFAGDGNTCDGNFRFTDKDGNTSVSPDELLGTYECP